MKTISQKREQYRSRKHSSLVSETHHVDFLELHLAYGTFKQFWGIFGKQECTIQYQCSTSVTSRSQFSTFASLKRLQ